MLQHFFGFVYLSAVSQLVSLTGTQAKCPVQFSQKSVVVEYGGSVAVNCTAIAPHYGMGWEASEGGVDKTSASVITWSVSDLTEWEIEPFCYINYDRSHAKPCEEKLPVTIYKTPGSVSISIVKHRGPMMERNQYQLQCDVTDVAPVQYLTVKWYKGQTLLDQTTFTDTIKTPVNETATILIRPDRADDGAQYRCEAELDLGAEGPQPPPTVTSQPLSAEVYCTQAGCPVQLNPKSVVVEYGGSVAVTCTASVPHYGMGWEASEGGVDKTSASVITWSVSDLIEWEIEPFCYINYDKSQAKPCEEKLPVTIYKTPDSVSISIVNHSGPMMEGNQYQLQCDVHDVSPVQYLTVKWYKGQTLLDQTTFTDTIKTPVNETATLLIRPDRADNGAQYRCEAELKLGAEGPQPPPTVTSQPLSAEDLSGKDVQLWVYLQHFLFNCFSLRLLNMLQHFLGFVYLSAVSQLGSLTGTQAECPVQFSQKSVVVEYGGSVEVNCTATVQHFGMGWEASEGGVDKTSASVITWSVSDLTEWEIEPFCYINYDKSHDKPCVEELPVTVYKTPDSVSISIVKHRGPMMEGNQYELQCDVHDVAPVQYLTVKWYKGQTLLDQTTFTDTIKTPVNEMATLLIRPERADDGAQYTCEAELDLGAEGSQPPPTVTSQPLSAEVYYKPKHSNSTETIIKDDTVTLDCTVKANPAPTYTWDSEQLKEKSSSSKLPSSTLSPGKYTCTAENSLGSNSKVFIVKSTGGL
ncbi:vascular cell adhesion protein 1-like [Garra rufa]|uniref:vascular cell adhesion protein 1-like n=1 Tax=Garra rufa TaxID=137080 RepID=UPI003CCE6911